MDALDIIMTLMLTLSEPCTALPAQYSAMQGQHYRIERFACGLETVIRRYARWCSQGGFWTHGFLLENERTGEGVYLDRFAGLQAGWHVTLDDVYYPACGA